MPDIIAEGEWLASLDERSKTVFLVALAHALTLAGRASYAIQSEGLAHPTWLRQVNEVQHRVLACLDEVLRGAGNADFQRSIAGWVLNQPDDALTAHMALAWAHAKAR